MYQFITWFKGRHGPEPGTIFLSQRRVYILPTRQGLTFAVALLLMLLGSINYTLSLGFILTFLLAGMALVAILHTFRNLAHLHISAGKVAPVFAGDTAQFHLFLDNRGHVDRYSIALKCGDQRVETDVPASRVTDVAVPVKAAARGWLALDRVTIETRFPLGFFRAWSYVQPDMMTLVYPKPDAAGLPEPVARPDMGDAVNAGVGTDDFSGLRPYQDSDSPRHIAWKAVARSDVMLTKLFSGRAASELWFDFAALPDHLPLEAKLSRLTRWALLAEERGLRFGLKLPGVEVGESSAMGTGDAYLHQCLKELALFGNPQAGSSNSPQAGSSNNAQARSNTNPQAGSRNDPQAGSGEPASNVVTSGVKGRAA
ncbi:MAG: DUF58 domain-containing protein [Betaproteobacteria bacterium]|nr:DUF58 domain-containing protein [Betaproteobacteria bacterium]